MKTAVAIDRFEDAVVVALGSNMPGNFPSVRSLLEEAMARFGPLGLTVVARSCWWRSAAWPDAAGPSYPNGVVIVETDLGPAEVLAVLLRIERDFGRRRGEANAPRTLDLDLIAHGRLVFDGPGLILPHPRAAERLFVMGPLAEILPAWTHPATGGTAAALARRAKVGRDAAPLTTNQGVE